MEFSNSEPNQNFYVLIGRIGGHIDFEEAFSIHRKDPVAAIQAAAKAAQEIYRKDWMPIIASIEMILQN